MSAHIAHQAIARIAQARRHGLAARKRSVPVTRPPTLIEADYAHRLVGIVDRMQVAARHAIDVLPEILRADSTAIRLDDDPGRRGRRAVERVRAEVEQSTNDTLLEGLAHGMAKRISAHQLGEIQRQSKAALGVDVVFHDPKVQPLISGFVHENVSLIKKLQGSTLDELEAILTRAVSDGARAEAIAAQIEARFGISERHARLIALDQVGKLNGQISEARNTELGIQSYNWISLLVGNRRPEHVARHGKPFRYDRPPADGHPGRAICCRCLQQPVFDDIYAELDALGV